MHLKTIWPLEKLEMQLKKAAAAGGVSEILGSSEGRSAAAVVRSQRWLSHKIGFFSIEKLSVTRPVLHTET